MQEEASVINTPCVISRNETEWTRLVDAGKNFVAGNKKEGILKTCSLLMDDDTLEMVKRRNVELVSGVDRNMLSILSKIAQGN